MPTTVIQTLTGPQFAAITDFTDLWLEFTATTTPANAVTLRDGTTVVTLRDGTTVVTTR